MKSINVYTYGELDYNSQRKALNNNRYINIDAESNYLQYIADNYQDSVDIFITDFDLEKNLVKFDLDGQTFLELAQKVVKNSHDLFGKLTIDKARFIIFCSELSKVKKIDLENSCNELMQLLEMQFLQYCKAEKSFQTMDSTVAETLINMEYYFYEDGTTCHQV